MTTKLSSTLYQPTVLGRIRMLAVATVAVLAISAALGVSTSRADTGEVYFDGNNNAAAGDPDFLFSANLTGIQNVGLGRTVMTNLTSGSNNVATGTDALFTNESGSNNVAAGFQALFQNSTGTRNVATGTDALQNNNGDDNVATGSEALLSNTTGFDNVATGSSALTANTTGHDNVATGISALFNNTTGDNNVATSTSALSQNTTGNNNVAVGRSALTSNTSGSANVAIGQNAGQNLTTGSNNIDIANAGKAAEAGTIRIGNPNKHTAAFIAGIRGTNVGGTAQSVVINSNGKLGTAPARAAGGLSAAEGEWLFATVKRQQRQIDRLRERVRGG